MQHEQDMTHMIRTYLLFVDFISPMYNLAISCSLISADFVTQIVDFIRVYLVSVGILLNYFNMIIRTGLACPNRIQFESLNLKSQPQLL